MFKKISYLFILLSSFFVINSCAQKPITIAVPSYTQAQIIQESKKLNDFFHRETERTINNNPTFATYLGRKTRYGELNDISYEFSQSELKHAENSLKELKTFNFEALDEQSKVSYQLYKESIEKQVKNFKYFYHGYFVNQMFGAHSNLPSFIINMHRVSNEQDAKDYISRLNGFKKSFEQLITILKTQNQKGIKMPNFVFDKVIRDSKNLIAGYPLQSTKNKNPLYQDFEKKITALKLPKKTHNKLLADAKLALKNSVKISYNKFITLMKKYQAESKVANGAWALPDGKNYYNVALENITSTKMTGPEIHQLGLKEVERIQNEMRLIMKQVNFKGTLADFFKHINDSPQYYFKNNAEGKSAYLKETNKIIAHMKSQLPTVFNLIPKAKLEVKPVEPFREKSAGIAFYNGPAIDGSRPGTYYVNLSDMSSVAMYDMEALAYHEAVPGHHMQIAIAQELQGLPLFRKLGGYTAYSEGWGLYAEYLPKEMGLYSDPYSDFGRLSMEIWRACRLVVDTGIHYYKWSREKSIKYLEDNTPSSNDEIVKGVERYFVMPGQATAYKIGQLKILQLREKSKKALGAKFDIKEFHDNILKNGALPLKVLETNIDKYIESKSL